MTDAEIEDLCIEAGLMHRTERGGIVLVFAEDLSRPEMVAGVRKLLELRDAEASAPKLSDEQILQFADECGPGGKENRYSDPWLAEHYIAFARSILTRASAATQPNEADK